MEIFLKNRLSFNYEITFLPCASFPFVNTCVLADTCVIGKEVPEVFAGAPGAPGVVGTQKTTCLSLGVLPCFLEGSGKQDGGGGGGGGGCLMTCEPCVLARLQLGS